MYQFEATVYELPNGHRYQGELYQEGPDGRQVMVSGHVVRSREGIEFGSDHDEILRGIRHLCMELAQNLDVSLF